MDGCLSKLKEITDLLDTYTDAHSTGICGPNGSGLVCELGLQDKVLARVHTFAIILGSTILKEYLINYAKPLIFSTFLPLHTLISIRLSYEYMIDHYEELYPMLKSRIVLFRKLLQPYRDIPLLDSNSPIQGNKNVCEAAEQLQQDGLDVRPIRSPTVPKGRERLRICLHLHNTDDDIRKLVYFISQLSIFKSNDIYSKL
ncbi:hypothetical protein HDV02_001291 [Globomyces sp. JEL0801]|nr:hypothetical protein HDV02_001291 [Globomyces sp. JEL0801]